MPLTNTQLKYYDSNVLRLPADKRTEYHKQVDRLIAELSKSIREKTEIKIKKVVKAGSFAKFTILRKTATDPVDVDVVFYIDAGSVDGESLQTLNDKIYELLIDVYPTKSVEDFEIQRKAAKVSFVGTGLDVDIVPVIADDSRDGYGWQYDLQDGSKTETCAPCQIKFVRDRKDKDSDFRTLVRTAKRWRNYAELTHLKSFHIELILAYILDQEGLEGLEGLIEQRFRKFLLYIAQSELKDSISFPENALPLANFSDPVVIIDPVCSTNNTASRISEAERQEIVKAADEAWEAANFASAEDDTEIWKEIFGPRFKVEDA
jgi:tRNA nucleotidyltransferase (CCA-adding enzyme)